MTSKSVLHRAVEQSTGIAESTRNKYLRDLNAWIDFAGADPNGWTRRRTQEFYSFLINTRNLRPQSATRLMSSVHYASRWWAHQENDPRLDFAVVQVAPPGHENERQILSESAARALIEGCQLTHNAPDLRDRALIIVGLETGMRRMSIAGMTLEGTITSASKSKTGYPIAYVPLKGRGENLYPVPLSDVAIQAIEPWRTWLARSKIKTGALFRGLDVRIGPAGKNVYQVHESISPTAIQKMVAARGKRAGIGHVHPHMFRHTFVSWRMEMGVLPHEVAAMTGHTMGELGALERYINKESFGARIRNTTPSWLVEMMGV